MVGWLDGQNSHAAVPQLAIVLSLAFVFKACAVAILCGLVNSHWDFTSHDNILDISASSIS